MASVGSFGATIGVGLADSAIREFSDTGPIGEENIFLPVSELNGLDSTLLNPLDSPVRENALLFSVCEDALDRSIGEYYLFSTVGEMLLNLAVGEFKNLQTVVKSGLSRFGLSEVVDYLEVREGLLDVLIIEVYNSVAIGEGLTFDSVVEDHFLLAVCVHSLDLAIASNVLIYDLLAGGGLTVVLGRELKAEIFLFLVVSALVNFNLNLLLFLLLVLLDQLISFFNFKFFFLLIVLFVIDLRAVNFFVIFTKLLLFMHLLLLFGLILVAESIPLFVGDLLVIVRLDLLLLSAL